MTEWGLFNDEGCVESGFSSHAAAVQSLSEDYTEDDELIVKQICPDHEEQPQDGCEECADQDDDEDEGATDEQL